jgi:hypothetical protein
MVLAIRIWFKVEYFSLLLSRGPQGRDHMVIGFMTIYVISVYHH